MKNKLYCFIVTMESEKTFNVNVEALSIEGALNKVAKWYTNAGFITETFKLMQLTQTLEITKGV